MISTNLIKTLIQHAKHKSFVFTKSCQLHKNANNFINSSHINPITSKILESRSGDLGMCQQRCHYATQSPEQARATKLETVSIKFVLPDGQVKTVNAKLGSTFLDVVLDNNVNIDGFGACEGTLSCSTCHLVFGEDDFKKLETKPSDEELDMLDLAFGLTDTSRLGCQIKVTKDMDGIQVSVPQGVADARS